MFVRLDVSGDPWRGPTGSDWGCHTDTYITMDDPDLTLEDATRENVEGIVNACTARTGGTNPNSTQTLPAEEIGG